MDVLINGGKGGFTMYMYTKSPQCTLYISYNLFGNYISTKLKLKNKDLPHSIPEGVYDSEHFMPFDKVILNEKKKKKVPVSSG